MAEEAEVKSTEEVKPQETKSQEKSQVKKAPSIIIIFIKILLFKNNSIIFFKF